MGKTTRTLHVRLLAHLNAAKRGDAGAWEDDTYRARWIRKLAAEGVEPEIKEIGSGVDAQDLNKAEEHYIKFHKEQGCRLTNLTPGGGGDQTGTTAPDEVRRRISVGKGGGPFTDEAGTRYETLHGASRALGVPHNMIGMILRGVRGSIGGHTFRWIDPEREAQRVKKVEELAKIGKIGAVVDQHGTRYESAKAAAAATGMSPFTVAHVVRGMIPQAKGFIFSMASDDPGKHPDRDKDAIVAGYLAGQSTRALAQKYGRAASGVFNALKRWGVPLRSKSEAEAIASVYTPGTPCS